MKILISLTLLSFATGGFAAERLIRSYDWQQLAGAGTVRSGEVVQIDGVHALKLSNPKETRMSASVLTIEEPQITANIYAIRGKIKYQKVRGDGYLELWSHFPASQPGMPANSYFSRTLAEVGEVAKITGDSNWREFSLPFDRTGTTNLPMKIEMNLHLPGPGEVFLSDVRLVEFTSDQRQSAKTAAPAPWWSERTAGLFGGGAGALIGCVAGLLAVLASKGQARSFVTFTSQVLIVVGAVSLVFGLAALLLRQPYFVCFPLLLLGVLLLAIVPFRLKQFQAQYEHFEMRRMRSLDALGG